MNDNGTNERTAMKSVLGDMVNSYTQRDKSIGFSNWLADKLHQEIPNMPPEESKKLAGEIINAVADYDNTLKELNQAVETGESTEGWLAKQLEGTYSNMSLDTVGEKLQMVETGITVSNMQLSGEVENIETPQVNIIDAEPVEWDKYSVKEKVCKIGEQAAFMSVAAIAKAIENIRQDGEESEIGIAFGKAFKENLKGEVKAVVAGAAKVAAEKGIGDMMPDTPTELICDMAGVAVEGAEALFDAANGDITGLDALDKIGRAGVAAGCRAGKYALQDVLLKVPYVGPLLVNLLGGLLDHMESPQFFENVYTVVHDAAIATWNGIKESVDGMIRNVRKIKLFH